MAGKKYDCDIPRLCLAIQDSGLALEKFRTERREAVKQFVGNHWADDGAEFPVPVNLLSLYVQIVGLHLIPTNPRVMLSTHKREHRAMVAAMQSWCNKEIERTNLENTLQRCVLDALFSISIAYVGIASEADAVQRPGGRKGVPFASRVDLEDWRFDREARDLEEVGWMAHRFSAPLEVIRDSPEYNARLRKELQPTVNRLVNTEGDEKIGTLGRGLNGSRSDGFEDRVDLWQVWIPRKGVVLTLSDDQVTGGSGSGALGTFDPLREQEYVGPEDGPYAVLPLQGVPGNAMPKGPIQDLIDLHMWANDVYTKMGSDSVNEKTLLLFAGQNDQDAKRINDAANGQSVKIDRPDTIKEAKFRGMTAESMQAGIHAVQRFKEWGGNLDMLGGLAAQSATATQDKMLNENASRVIGNMQKYATSFAQAVCKKMCWLWYHDPRAVYTTTYQLPGNKLTLPRHVYPDRPEYQGAGHTRRASWEDLEVRIDPYSLQPSTPASRLQALNQVVMQIQPFMPLAAQQGIMFDLHAYLDKVAKYADLPDLPEILTSVEPPQQEGGMEQDTPSMPAQTERKYTRENVPMRTQRGDEMNQMNALVGIRTGGNQDRNGAPRAS